MNKQRFPWTPLGASEALEKPTRETQMKKNIDMPHIVGHLRMYHKIGHRGQNPVRQVQVARCSS